jgi:hypothetical protein
MKIIRLSCWKIDTKASKATSSGNLLLRLVFKDEKNKIYEWNPTADDLLEISGAVREASQMDETRKLTQ